MGKAHANPILEIRVYQVSFPGGKVAELTTNFIAETMYAQCNARG